MRHIHIYIQHNILCDIYIYKFENNNITEKINLLKDFISRNQESIAVTSSKKETKISEVTKISNKYLVSLRKTNY